MTNMIIKILSHKQAKFKYLISYINKENRKNPILVTQNIHTIQITNKFLKILKKI